MYDLQEFVPCLWLALSFYYQDHLFAKESFEIYIQFIVFYLWMTFLEFHIKAHCLTKITKVPMFSSRNYMVLCFMNDPNMT